MNLLRRLHIWVTAYCVKWWRVHRTLEAFSSLHKQELSTSPAYYWPTILARQDAEIRAIRAGKLDKPADVTDRKSWGYPFMPACTAQDSEILTQRGFIPVADMREDDVFATRTKGGFFEWQAPTEIHKSWYKGKMVSIRGSAIDALVTPNHRMVVRRQQRRANRYWGYTDERIEFAGAICEDTAVKGVPGSTANTSTWDIVQIPLRARVKKEAWPDVAESTILSTLKDDLLGEDDYGNVREVSYQDYEGYVYCPSVPNGVICVRRNGKVFWCGNSVNRLSVPVIKSCFSSDTEIMTHAGWKPVSAITKKDELASLSSDGEFSWVRPKKIIKYKFKGSMLHFQSKSLDFMVTPDHRMLGRQVYRGRPFQYSSTGFMFAKDVAALPHVGNAYPFQVPMSAAKWRGVLPKSGRVIKLTAEAEAIGRKPDSYDVDLMDYVALIGIFLAEGSTSGTMAGMDRHGGRPLPKQAEETQTIRANWKPKQHRGHHVTIFQQRNSKCFGELKALCERLPFGLKYRNNRTGFDCCSKALWEALHPLGNKYTKYIPTWVKDLPVEYLQVLVHWMVAGDGHKPKKQHPHIQRDLDTFSYASSSKQLIDDLSEVFQKLGLGSHTYKIPGDRKKKMFGKLVHGTSDFYWIYPSQLAWTGVGNAEKVEYDDYVYCPALPPNETVLVRRNGKSPAWCGNTPYNLRRLSRTPVPRRALGLITGAIITQSWDVRPVADYDKKVDPDDQEDRINIAKKMFHHPNNQDSFQTFIEMGLEDMMCFGGFVVEMRMTPDVDRPLKLWNVNVECVPGDKNLVGPWRLELQLFSLRGRYAATRVLDPKLC